MSFILNTLFFYKDSEERLRIEREISRQKDRQIHMHDPLSLQQVESFVARAAGSSQVETCEARAAGSCQVESCVASAAR